MKARAGQGKRPGAPSADTIADIVQFWHWTSDEMNINEVIATALNIPAGDVEWVGLSEVTK